MEDQVSEQSNNGSGSAGGVNTGYSAEYVKELRDEAASWRVKFRETEDKFNALNSKIETTTKQSSIQEILNQKEIKGVNPKWIELKDGMTPEVAVDNFLKEYPHLGKVESNPGDNNQHSPRNTRAPQVPNHDNSNIENTQVSELKAIKQDPIARSKLRNQYRMMLAKNSGSTYDM